MARGIDGRRPCFGRMLQETLFECGDKFHSDTVCDLLDNGRFPELCQRTGKRQIGRDQYFGMASTCWFELVMQAGLSPRT